jgi:hypothetical protein
MSISEPLGTIVDQSEFRKWFKEYLRPLPDRRVQWPQLLRQLIAEELDRIREVGTPYAGPNVFIDRDERALEHASHPGQSREDILVYGLYRRSHQENQGILKVGGQDVWLVSCQVPNQGSYSRRCADLLGVKKDGSLVVLECKVESNQSETPLYALLEGLDYLGHLLIPHNLERLSSGFEAWKTKPRDQNSISRVPAGFENVAIERSCRHSVLVLAPRGYYEFMRTDSVKVDQDWEYLSDRFWPTNPGIVGIDFAMTDYTAAPSDLLALTSRQ